MYSIKLKQIHEMQMYDGGRIVFYLARQWPTPLYALGR